MSEWWYVAEHGDPRDRYDISRHLMYIKEINVDSNGNPSLVYLEGTKKEEDIPPLSKNVKEHMYDDTMIDARKAQVLAVRVQEFLGMTSPISPDQYYNIAVEFKKLRDEPEYLCQRSTKNYWEHYYAYLNAMAGEVLDDKLEEDDDSI